MRQRSERFGPQIASRPERPSNADLAELLALEAESAGAHLARAYRRAARRAFTWPVEATELLAAERSLTELAGIGPFLSKVIADWLAEERVPGPPPQLRRGFLTLTEARRRLARGSPPVRGDLQMHTTWSDGGSTLATMADAAADRGYAYIAITDHSAGLRIVRGLDEATLERQGAEIEKLNLELRSRGASLCVLRSVEMNLDPEGKGDLDPAALPRLDVILASFHSALRRTDEQTNRYLAAIRNPDVHILGHPRGRIYNFRIGLHADWPEVFAAAAEADKAVEIDAYPDRQDLDVELLRLAAEAGTRISIGTDAHHHPQLDWIDLGRAAVLEAGIAEERIVNLMSLDALRTWVSGLRGSQSRRRGPGG
jgi:histidinol phosphatase-like PHP family hydrolase